MTPTTIAILVLTLFYVIGVRLVNRTDRLPSWLDVYGPCLMLTTERGKGILDTLANKYPTFWRYWGDAGILVATVVLVSQVVLLLFAAAMTFFSPADPTSVHQPTNMLVIPGVNDFLPLSVAPEIGIALIAALIVHEGGHGLYCRVGDIDIERMGALLFAVIPIGAFVEPDETQEENATLFPSLRMYAAGVMNNFALSAVCFLLFFGLTGFLVVPAPGAAVGTVHPDSPADTAGITAGDRITAINSTQIDSNEQFLEEADNHSANTLSLTLNDNRTVTVDKRVYVTGSLEATGIDPGTTVTAVDNTSVQTTTEFTNALRNTTGTTASVTFANGSTGQLTAGVPIQVTQDSPAAEAGLETGKTFYVTHVEGERVVNTAAVETTLTNQSSSTNVTVSDGGGEKTITLPNASSMADLGIHAGGETAGLQTAEIGVQFYGTEAYLGFASGDFSSVGSPIIVAMLLLALPMASVMGFPYNFAGFTGAQANFFTTTGLPAEFTGAIFFTLNVFFWTAWVNLHLGLFNCIPTIVLDGGHMVRDTVAAAVDKTGVENPERIGSILTTAVLVSMLLALLTVIFGPSLLA